MALFSSNTRDKACEEFVPQPVRKLCKNCRYPFAEHSFSEDDVDEMKALIKDLSEYPEIRRDTQYAWIPPGCPENRTDEYFQKFREDQVPKHQSIGQNNRLKRIAYQIPLTDLSVEKSRFVESECEKQVENLIERLKKGVVRIGNVKEFTNGSVSQCPKCLFMLQPEELVISSGENGSQSFHPTCFVCFQCEDLLADLIHCSDVGGNVFCLRHYNENVKKRCHTCDELIYSKEYSFVGDKIYHREHLMCFSCDGQVKGDKGFVKDGEVYCVTCYKEQFISQCKKCQKKIDIEGRHLIYENNAWHEECFSCDKCGILLSDSPFELNEEKFYCLGCFREDFAPRCGGCDEIFDPEASVVKYEEQILHVNCFKCVDCEETIGTGPFVPHEGRQYCKSCYRRNFGVRCFRCKGPIDNDKGLMYNQQPYHEDCFTCFNCSTKVSSKPFKTVDDNTFCMSCYTEKFCKKCNACEQPIVLGTEEDVMYSHQDYRWHSSCFVCNICKKSLAGAPFMMRENVLVCKKCLAKDRTEEGTAERESAAERKE